MQILPGIGKFKQRTYSTYKKFGGENFVFGKNFCMMNRFTIIIAKTSFSLNLFARRSDFAKAARTFVLAAVLSFTVQRTESFAPLLLYLHSRRKPVLKQTMRQAYRVGPV